jgi:hypothetical protein
MNVRESDKKPFFVSQMPETLLQSPKKAIRLLGKPEVEEPAEAEKVSELAAGYMELAGAKKDGNCRIVDVSGGISKELGCCNLFRPESAKVSKFSCGTCHFEE